MTKPKRVTKWIFLIPIMTTVILTAFIVADAYSFVQEANSRVDSLASFLRQDGIQTLAQPWPDFKDLVVSDCHGDDGLFLGSADRYATAVAATGQTLTVDYAKSSFGGIMWFLVLPNVPFNGTVQIVLCKHTLW